MCSFVVKLILSQISLILSEFTHFIFIIINTHLSIQTQYLSQNTQILSKSTPIPSRDLSVSFVIVCSWLLCVGWPWVWLDVVGEESEEIKNKKN